MAFSWRDICRTSHLKAQINPTSIALVVAFDYLSATRMDLPESRARTAVLTSVTYHKGAGKPGHKTHSRLNGTPGKARVGGSCSLTRCILP